MIDGGYLPDVLEIWVFKFIIKKSWEKQRSEGRRRLLLNPH